MEINILIEEGQESAPAAGWLQKVIETVLTAENAPPNAEISLVITGQERIQELNREYRGLDQPTDVLSFALAEVDMRDDTDGQQSVEFITPPDGLIHLGEVIISLPQAQIQAEEDRHSINQEMAALIVHGVLHILGYDHEIAEKEPAMKAREKQMMEIIEKELS